MKIDIIRTQGADGSLTPLESGIIGGSVASLPGFLGAYLTAKQPEGVVFLCRLKDGRHFYGYCTRLLYENIINIVFKRKNMDTGCCMLSLLLAAFYFFKKML